MNDFFSLVAHVAILISMFLLGNWHERLRWRTFLKERAVNPEVVLDAFADYRRGK